MTNRDLYLFVADLAQKHKGTDLTLEEYLKTLWHMAQADRADTLTFARFTALLGDAFTGPRIPFDPSWQLNYRRDTRALDGFASWEPTILRQIVDLHEMRAAGAYENDQRYFGLEAPRGPRWYNFDPLGFLECAVAGSFGGWEPGDETGRTLVPGQVAVMTDHGIVSADPAELANDIVALDEVTWEAFEEFLCAGQYYE